MTVRRIASMLMLVLVAALTPAQLRSAPAKPGPAAGPRYPSVVIFVGEG